MFLKVDIKKEDVLIYLSILIRFVNSLHFILSQLNPPENASFPLTLLSSSYQKKTYFNEKTVDPLVINNNESL